MLRPFAVIVAVLIASGVFVDSGYCQSTGPGAGRAQLSQEALERVRAAMALYEAQQPKAALDALGQVANDINAPWQVRSLAGELYEKTGDFTSAARFYQSIVNELGPKVSDLPGNLHFRLGTVTFETKEYGRATSSLELALKYRGYQDDGRIYRMLTIAYRQLGRIEMAERASLLHAAADPGIRPDISAITSSAWSADSVPLSAIPAPDVLHEVLAAPAPIEPPTESNFPLSAAALRYSDALEKSGWTRAASRYRLAATDLVYKDASTAIDRDNDNDKGLRELARVSALTGYADLPLKVRGVGLQLEMQAHLNASRFTHAVGALERLAESKAYDRAEVTDTAIRLQRLAFANISFNLRSGLPRSRDPKKFLDTNQLVRAEEEARGEKTSTSSKHRAERAKPPYSELSHSEDWAEIASAISMAAMFPAAKRELLSILENCLNERVFELPVKFSLHQFASGFLDENGTGRSTLRNRLEREIFDDATPRPDAVTLDAYTAGEKLAALIRQGAGSSESSDRSKK